MKTRIRHRQLYLFDDPDSERRRRRERTPPRRGLGRGPDALPWSSPMSDDQKADRVRELMRYRERVELVTKFGRRTGDVHEIKEKDGRLYVVVFQVRGADPWSKGRCGWKTFYLDQVPCFQPVNETHPAGRAYTRDPRWARFTRPPSVRARPRPPVLPSQRLLKDLYDRRRVAMRDRLRNRRAVA